MSYAALSLTARVCLMQIRFLLQAFQCICKSHTCRNSGNNVCCGFASLCWVTLLASLFVVFFLVLFLCWQWRPAHKQPHIKQHHCNANNTTGAWYLWAAIDPLFVFPAISSCFWLTFLSYLPPSFPPSFLPSVLLLFGMFNLLLVINRQERLIMVLINILQPHFLKI